MGPQRRIVVSVDFGTTYSGVAWSETSKPGVQHVISKWPSADGFKSSPKVPTELRRVANGWQWGFQIPASAKRLRFFKLKLDDPSGTTGESESPQQLTKIFLTYLHDHFIKVLEDSLSPTIVRTTPMDFVVTVPAIWSPAAKQATERAAAMAGFCSNRRITLVSEPEAAALYTLKNNGTTKVKRGQKYIICDAGGGTVDLITYEVADSDRMLFKEVTEGTGGRCGSGMLNMRFRRHLKQKHGEKYWPDERLVGALNEFEAYKKTFSPSEEPLTLKVDPALGLRRDRYMIPQDEMKMKIFEPIMKDIICLIEEQLTMAGGHISAVILVGGFGQSQYLKSRVRETVKKSIPVLQPGDGWAAVVKGAALHGLGQHINLPSSPKIVSRVARGSYGTCLMTKYDPKQHDPREAFWDEKEEEMVVFVMMWFIRKGESYPEDKPSNIEFQCDVPVHMGKAPQTEIEVFVNNEEQPPRHLDANTRCIAVLSLDVMGIPTSVKRQASIQRMGGFRYFSIPGMIEARYDSAMITYSAKLGGVVHDRIRVDYER